jgi:hypothetical protein
MTTKLGKHGTLKLYRATYNDGPDSGMPEATCNLWAYSMEHAEERWLDGNEDEGFTLVSIKLA